MTRRPLRGVALVAILSIAALLTTSVASAEMDGSPQKLEGTWLAIVTRIDPPAGVPPTFVSLHMYFASGEIVETTNTGRTNRSIGLGHWVRTGNRQFTNTFWFLRFDPGEQYAGVTKVIRNIRLSEDQRRFRAVSLQELYDVSGKLVGTRRSTEAGERLALAELEDQPPEP